MCTWSFSDSHDKNAAWFADNFLKLQNINLLLEECIELWKKFILNRKGRYKTDIYAHLLLLSAADSSHSETVQCGLMLNTSSWHFKRPLAVLSVDRTGRK